jgi:lipopolysaccharide transport system ATP-binding protein
MIEKNNTLISIKNLSAAYPVYDSPKSLIVEMITGKKNHDLFWALNDINLEIKEKQRVGIIGPNGSGKTTLLKIITGNLKPTSGYLQVNGNISAMLSLTSFLNPEETGLENIKFNLLMNGCKSSEIEKLTEEIIEFTELSHFIYSPVKTYSSGMHAKLAFGITTAIKPEILVIDEILSVGDSYFVGKAMKRMMNLCEQGKGLIFVSHSLSAVQMLCNRVIWLDNGCIRETGAVDYVLKKYEEDYRKKEDEATRIGNRIRKNKLINKINQDELDQANIFRIRLVSENDQKSFQDTHFVRLVEYSVDNSEFEKVNFNIQDINDTNVNACLEVLTSEWGRLYNKQNSECRVLSSKSGKSKGGHLLFKILNSTDKIYELKLYIEIQSILNQEKIDVEFINYETGKWEKATILERQNLKDKWESISVKLKVPKVNPEIYQSILEKIENDNKPDAEIKNVQLVCDGKQTYCINERDSFEIQVNIIANHQIPCLDVGIKINRSDGYYVFWQSSGFNDNNLINFQGEKTVCFIFEKNYFPAGEYEVSAYCANGWNWPDNYPYTEVFTRRVSELKFTVRHEFPGLDFGLINMRVPITYQSSLHSETI